MTKGDPLLRAFGFRVKKMREAAGLTQEALAEKAELDRTYLSDIERGMRNPGIRNVLRLVEAMGIPLSEFFKGLKQ